MIYVTVKSGEYVFFITDKENVKYISVVVKDVLLERNLKTYQGNSCCCFWLFHSRLEKSVKNFYVTHCQWECCIVSVSGKYLKKSYWGVRSLTRLKSCNLIIKRNRGNNSKRRKSNELKEELNRFIGFIYFFIKIHGL